VSDEPQPVTKARLWRIVAEVMVEDTPDPAYDVRACDKLVDEIGKAALAALERVERVSMVDLDVQVVDS
jgi:hypothetical protein